MLTRGVILGLGMLALLAGLALSFLWYRQSTVGPAPPVVAMIPAKTVLVAAHAMPAGTLLRPGDMSWDEKPAAAVVGADIVRGSVPDAEFVGAVTRRAFAAREPLTAAELAKPGDREFLIAALGPGRRAVSINVDAVKSTAGLVAPGDHVDVILTQTFAAQASDPAHRSVGETVLRDLRVIAVDQTISPVASKPGDGRNALGEAAHAEDDHAGGDGASGSDAPGGRSARQDPACPARTAGSSRVAPADASSDARRVVAHMGIRRLKSIGSTQGCGSRSGTRDGASRNRYHSRQQDRATLRVGHRSRPMQVR